MHGVATGGALQQESHYFTPPDSYYFLLQYQIGTPAYCQSGPQFSLYIHALPAIVLGCKGIRSPGGTRWDQVEPANTGPFVRRFPLVVAISLHRKKNKTDKLAGWSGYPDALVQHALLCCCCSRALLHVQTNKRI